MLYVDATLVRLLCNSKLHYHSFLSAGSFTSIRCVLVNSSFDVVVDAVMSHQLKARKWSIDPHRIYHGPKVKYHSPEKFRDMAACLRELEQKKEFHKFGIVGVIPPDGAAPEPFDVLKKGAAAFGDQRCLPALGEYSNQRVYKWAPHVTYVENTFKRCEHSWDEFVWMAKKLGDFEMPDRDVDEAELILWERLKEVEAVVSDENLPPPKMYPYTIDGSLFKIHMKPEHEVRESNKLFSLLYLVPTFCNERDLLLFFSSLVSFPCFIPVLEES